MFAVITKMANGVNWKYLIRNIFNLHMAATCLHYGQEAFEGLKGIQGKG